MKPVIGKRHVTGHFYEAVVFDAADRNRILYESGLGWNKRGKAKCAEWLRGFELRVQASNEAR